ncbi:MAG: hypothetical protein V4793_20425 [Paraburkholderia tropica]|uniref:Secreted protein n=1 Tax=Paraburkholderia tropica TaxID=92647 RepID=A0AAQ1GLW8_9BURK|nr:hypothetical protein [Paraburkholderia tropica]MDE1143331.1 hypothetical protein [Paraburkholderia tropica]PXX10663.1 hypothetical protein C7400_121140 [Paraburkholderia tropica]PZW75418.1 hypothetical protein C7399_121139 [Paraburkholderia tropica]SEK11197.1 hypothetical protein SAMN05216550_12013 [Paraburkholderia tropica]
MSRLAWTRAWVRRAQGAACVAACVAGLCAVFGASAVQAAPVVEAGDYIFVEGGSGHGSLSVKNGRFSIETLGGNCHECQVDGKIVGRTGVATDGETTCRISMTGANGQLKLDTGDSDACRSFCGMRADFQGEYRKPPEACRDAARATRLKSARALYAKKDYAGASAALGSLVGECQTFMNWIERDSARSDLALAQYHLGQSAQCVATLAQTVAIQNGTDELPPCDADNYRSVGKAILFNEAMCRRAAAGDKR